MSAQLAIAWEDTAASTERHPPDREPHRLCAACQQRPARFRYHGVVKADRSHTLCFQCYRAAIDGLRNVEPVGRVSWIGRRVRGKASVLDPADRYGELAYRRRRAQIAARHALDVADEVV